jgi:4-carboxymuconolactone decarboxylase
LQGLGAAVRYRTSLSDRIREMAILAVATWWDSDFERYAHEAVGRAVGLTEEEVAQLREVGGGRPEDPVEAAALDVVWTLLRDRDLDDDAYRRAREHLSEAVLFELTTLVGYYATLALVMRVFRADERPASRD